MSSERPNVFALQLCGSTSQSNDTAWRVSWKRFLARPYGPSWRRSYSPLLRTSHFFILNSDSDRTPSR